MKNLSRCRPIHQGAAVTAVSLFFLHPQFPLTALPTQRMYYNPNSDGLLGLMAVSRVVDGSYVAANGRMDEIR
ncbi:hypothetical protein ABFV83_14800 [Lacrimispora sp. BS-2]|uniref:Uncharacterized protein n=1 Tax=Lacrimispora sp. BS-2 TaxID=3151850 RepID=A0AAU7PLF7_9FIRM